MQIWDDVTDNGFVIHQNYDIIVSVCEIGHFLQTNVVS